MANGVPEVEWELVEAEYRTGQKSIPVILSEFNLTMGQLENRAKRFGWVRDLAERVRAETAELMLAKDAPSGSTLDEAVSRAAERASDILLGHRVDAKRLRNLLNMAITKLEYLLNPNLDFEEASVEELRRASMVLGKSQGLLDGVNRVADVTMKVISIERQAFDLDKGAAGTTLDAIQEQAEAARQELIRRGVFVGNTDGRIIENTPVRKTA